MSQKIAIGFVCEKGNGHFEFIGDPDNGGCGSHNVANIYIEIDDELVGDAEVQRAVKGAHEGFIKRLVEDSERRAVETAEFFRRKAEEDKANGGQAEVTKRIIDRSRRANIIALTDGTIASTDNYPVDPELNSVVYGEVPLVDDENKKSALRNELIAGEASGEPEVFDFDTFIQNKNVENGRFERSTHADRALERVQEIRDKAARGEISQRQHIVADFPTDFDAFESL